MRDSQWSAGHMFCTPDLEQWHFFISGKGDEPNSTLHIRVESAQEPVEADGTSARA
jgi:hypothetical protein